MTRRTTEQTVIADEGARLSRRGLLMTGTGLAGATLVPELVGQVFAADRPPLGSSPDGVSGDSVFIGISVPRTGTYATQGEDELKGYQLAVEHLNAGHELIKKISPKTTKGVLGKQSKIRRGQFEPPSRTRR